MTSCCCVHHRPIYK